MIDNTNAQAVLHPELFGVHHRAIIEIAKAHNAIGWTVNGAGGVFLDGSCLDDGVAASLQAVGRQVAQFASDLRAGRAVAAGG